MENEIRINWKTVLYVLRSFQAASRSYIFWSDSKFDENNVSVCFCFDSCCPDRFVTQKQTREKKFYLVCGSVNENNICKLFPFE